MGYLKAQIRQEPNSGRSRLIIVAYVFLSNCFIFFSASAQFLEFGGGVGAFNYSGDLIRGYKIQNVSTATAVHYRMNFNNELSVKWSGLFGNIESRESPIDAFAQQRAYSYSMRVGEVSSVIEYHFLDYKHEHSRIKWSPYAFGGFGFTRVLRASERREDFNRTQAVIPFGIGFKHLLGKRFSIDAEMGFRRTFFDWLDNTSEADLSVKDYQYGNPNDDDWYSFIGVTLSFILYEIPCPFPYVPNKYMLRAKFR
jgi:hypothetical protein